MFLIIVGIYRRLIRNTYHGSTKSLEHFWATATCCRAQAVWLSPESLCAAEPRRWSAVFLVSLSQCSGQLSGWTYKRKRCFYLQVTLKVGNSMAYFARWLYLYLIDGEILQQANKISFKKTNNNVFDILIWAHCFLYIVLSDWSLSRRLVLLHCFEINTIATNSLPLMLPSKRTGNRCAFD